MILIFLDNLNFDNIKIELKKTNEDLELAASVFAALIKSKQKNTFNSTSTIQTNNWWEQNYE